MVKVSKTGGACAVVIYLILKYFLHSESIKQLALHSCILVCGSSSSDRIVLVRRKNEMALEVVAILFLV